MRGLTVYGAFKGSRSWWVQWMCQELGLEFEHVPHAAFGPATKSPEYLAINPNAAVPAIKDGDFALWESMAINLYLAKKHSGKGLVPSSAEGEALVLQWSFWAVTKVEVPLMTLLVANSGHEIASEVGTYMLKHVTAWTRDEVMRCQSTLQHPLNVLDGELAGKAYLLGDAFSVADLNVSVVLSRNCVANLPGSRGAGLDLTQRPHLVSWLERCWSRPACPRTDELLTGLKHVSSPEP